MEPKPDPEIIGDEERRHQDLATLSRYKELQDEFLRLGDHAKASRIQENIDRVTRTAERHGHPRDLVA